MKIKNLLSGIAAMLVAVSTVWAFSAELKTENGAYIHPTTNLCTATYAPDCDEISSTPCEAEVPGLVGMQQIYRNNGLCNQPLFKL